jgi:hypothetical protein
MLLAQYRDMSDDEKVIGKNYRKGELALLWQIYSSCMFAPIHFRQCGHRCGGSRAMRATMA